MLYLHTAFRNNPRNMQMKDRKHSINKIKTTTKCQKTASKKTDTNWRRMPEKKTVDPARSQDLDKTWKAGRQVHNTRICAIFA